MEEKAVFYRISTGFVGIARGNPNDAVVMFAVAAAWESTVMELDQTNFERLPSAMTEYTRPSY